jgi:hypothetical protein
MKCTTIFYEKGYTHSLAKIFFQTHDEKLHQGEETSMTRQGHLRFHTQEDSPPYH